MANAAGGHYHAQGARPQFPAYASAGAAGYYTATQQQQGQHQPLSFQYYAPPPPQPPAPPGVSRFGASTTQQVPHTTPYQQHQTSMVARNPPPPPPPPPGEKSAPSPVNNSTVVTSAPSNISCFTTNATSTSLQSSAVNSGGYLPPLQPPPLPPMFPWMSPALAESMTSSKFGPSFREEASNLPFVPIIVNDADLAKMTESVIKEAEQVKSHQLQYYKDVINQDLPQPLKDMFQPLYCKLCILTLSSPVVAKDHYSGKRHKKAVETWLMKNSHLSTPKQRRDAGGGGPPQQQPASGTVVKTPGGGLGMTGPINGYIMKHNQNQATNLPRPTSLVASPAPPSLLSLDFGSNNNRKRPAPPAIPATNASVTPSTPATTASGTPVKPTPVPVPTSTSSAIQHPSTQSKPNFIGPQKPNSFPTLTAQPPKTANVPPALVAPAGSVSSSNTSTAQNIENKNFGSNFPNNGDFQAKRPRRDEEETRSAQGTAPGGPGAIRQPVTGPQQRNNFGLERERSGGNGGGPPPKSICEICNVQLSSKVMAEQHFNGKNHKAKLAALQEGKPAPINVNPTSVAAGFSGNSNEKSSHIGSSVHNENKNIVNKLLALSSQSPLPPTQQIPPPEEGNGPSFGHGSNPFHNQQFCNPRGGGAGRGGHPGGRGGMGQHGNINNRGGGGGRGRGGGPPFRNNNVNNSNSRNNGGNFNNKNRFNSSNNGRGRGR